MAMIQRRIASNSAPGVSRKLNIASGMVCVSPGILETKVMVAPNSPRLRAKASKKPEIRPGMVSGKVMVVNTFQGLAPNVIAACSSLGSIP